jgi:hypothetical protein
MKQYAFASSGFLFNIAHTLKKLTKANELSPNFGDGAAGQAAAVMG